MDWLRSCGRFGSNLALADTRWPTPGALCVARAREGKSRLRFVIGVVASAGNKAQSKTPHSMTLAGAGLDEWQQRGTRAAETLSRFFLEDGFGVFRHLIGCFKITVVRPVVFIFTAVG